MVKAYLAGKIRLISLEFRIAKQRGAAYLIVLLTGLEEPRLMHVQLAPISSQIGDGLL